MNEYIHEFKLSGEWFFVIETLTSKELKIKEFLVYSAKEAPVLLGRAKEIDGVFDIAKNSFVYH